MRAEAVQHDQQVVAEVVGLGHVDVEHGVADGEQVEPGRRRQLEQTPAGRPRRRARRSTPSPPGGTLSGRLPTRFDTAGPVGDQGPHLHELAA